MKIGSPYSCLYKFESRFNLTGQCQILVEANFCMFVGCSSTLNDTSITLDTARRRKQDDGGSLGK